MDGTKSIWRLDSVNAVGQPTKAYTGNFTRRYGYDAYGYPTSRTSGSFQNFTYDYDVARGNLSSRSTNSGMEEFTYDNLDRLTGYSLGIDSVTVQYDNLGNLLERSDVGTFTYGSPSAPYRITAASTTGNAIPMRNRTAEYNSFQRPNNISEGQDSAYFVYNADGDRVKMGLLKNDTTVMNKYYLSDCYEIEEMSDGTIIQRLYLNGDYYTASTILMKKNSQVWLTYYICRDQLGSITHIRSSTGTLLQELSYDAWGRMRNPSTMQVYAPGSEPEPYIGRGYGGHEYLKPFGLINMNARLYDPALGRFLSPDPYVQAPDYSQNFNRYSYCLNNPLKYSDPSGEIVVIDDWIIGFVKGFSRSISGNHEKGHHTWFGDAWASANRHAGNSAKIWGGLFAADTDKEGWGWQIWNRLTGETPQTMLGFFAAHGENIFGQVESVGYCEGATVVTTQGDAVFFGFTRAYTLGSYIIGNDELQPNVFNYLFQHEYGHYLQSQISGWSYLPLFGIPSLMNSITCVDNDEYLSRDTEQDAQARSLLYLTKYVDGFDYDDWVYNENKFFSGRFCRDSRSQINEAFLRKKFMYQNITFE